MLGCYRYCLSCLLFFLSCSVTLVLHHIQTTQNNLNLEPSLCVYVCMCKALNLACFVSHFVYFPNRMIAWWGARVTCNAGLKSCLSADASSNPLRSCHVQIAIFFHRCHPLYTCCQNAVFSSSCNFDALFQSCVSLLKRCNVTKFRIYINQLRGKQDYEHVLGEWSVVSQHSCGFVFSLTC